MWGWTRRAIFKDRGKKKELVDFILGCVVFLFFGSFFFFFQFVHEKPPEGIEVEILISPNGLQENGQYLKERWMAAGDQGVWLIGPETMRKRL